MLLRHAPSPCYQLASPTSLRGSPPHCPSYTRCASNSVSGCSSSRATRKTTLRWCAGRRDTRIGSALPLTSAHVDLRWSAHPASHQLQTRTVLSDSMPPGPARTLSALSPPPPYQVMPPAEFTAEEDVDDNLPAWFGGHMVSSSPFPTAKSSLQRRFAPPHATTTVTPQSRYSHATVT